MGAMITIHYDDTVIARDEVRTLSEAIHQIVREVMAVNDVFVYAYTAQVLVGADPIEVFIQVNASKVSDVPRVIDLVTARLTAWKQQSEFSVPINLNVIPVEWHYKIGI